MYNAKLTLLFCHTGTTVQFYIGLIPKKISSISPFNYYQVWLQTNILGSVQCSGSRLTVLLG